ncbi:hypothetical protein [Leptolyngbya sp. PCC 6406]|uniref:hypothetical protein n=1 Tax=Leptolyngbya sp. PCC 6406 TaxID=1173264 RepID=UPI0002ACBD90|nr:hypothetical protein [Leptolyngbya sp. PCC 6406]
MSRTALPAPDLDLTRRILEMATTGVYRESLFEALAPIATQRQIRSAIAQAKQFGLQSVRHLRDAELGTYYQVERHKYDSFQTAVAAAVPLTGDDLAAQILLTTRALRGMLAVAGGSAIALLILGGLCLLSGHLHSGRLAWVGAASIGGLWLIQRYLVRSLV